MKYALYGIAAFVALSALLVIGKIGKQREPITPREASLVVVFNATIATVLILAAGMLR